MQINCPQCRCAITINNQETTIKVDCPACGSRFELVTHSAMSRTLAPAGLPETASMGPLDTPLIGHFELMGELGCGAYGTVWRARDLKLDREVAVKIPRRSSLDAAETEYFLREARAAAQLNHPNIVTVHEAGEIDGKLFIASDLIRGISLADWLTGQQPTPREAAELCRTIAEALDYAHQQGIIHRDLKPGNILLDQELRPHLADFGLAKREAGEVTMTVEGQLLGTPAYMSPEQAKGDAHNADRRSDIYSLGVIFYELLTGHRPFRGNTRMLLHQVMNDEPSTPRKFDRSIPKDLETICLKCLEKDPDHRFQSAAELSNELQRYLDGKPIQSRAIGKVGYVWRWCKRQPGFATLAGLTMVLVLALAIGGPIAAVREASLRSEAEVIQRKLAVALVEINNARLAEQKAKVQFRELIEEYAELQDEVSELRLKKEIETIPEVPELSFNASQAGLGSADIAISNVPNMVGD